jgi:ABC-2 type transport system permease protein
MNNLIKTEWLKIKNYRAFWWMTGIVALSYPGINYLFYNLYLQLTSKEDKAAQVAKMLLGDPFAFPEVWHTAAFFSSWFIFIPSIIVIMFITNEYTYKTHRQNIIDGWSRNQFMTSKLIDVLIVSLLITLMYFLVALGIGLINAEKSVGIWQKSNYIALFALQTFAQLSIAFLIAFLTRKAFLALGIFLFYFIILEPAFVGVSRIFLNDIGRFMPLEISDRIIPVPAFLGKLDQEGYNTLLNQVNTHIILTILLTALVWFICYRINKRRDL